MIYRWENRLFSFYIGVNRIEMVDGYNSKLPDGRHFLMWDFDEVPMLAVRIALWRIQKSQNLPRIFLLNSGSENCWHANCFIATPWEQCRATVAATTYVDKKFLAIGILREFFTLRYSAAGDREISRATILPSDVAEDVDPYSLTSFATYPKKRR